MCMASRLVTPHCFECNLPLSGTGAKVISPLGLSTSKFSPQLCSWCESSVRKLEGGAQVELTIEFADGALGIHEVGWCLPEEGAGWSSPTRWGGFGDVRMNVIGTNGVLNLNFTPMDLYANDRGGWKLPDTRH